MDNFSHHNIKARLFLNATTNNTIMAYSNYDVAHAWANELDVKHYNSSMSHEDGKLYSYSTVIAQLIHCANGNTVCVMNKQPYSNSTSKHQSYALSALPKYIEVLELDPYQFVYGWSGIWAGRQTVEEDLEGLVKGIIRGFCGQLGQFKNSPHMSLKLERDVKIPIQHIQKYINLTGCTTWKRLQKAHYLCLNVPESAVRKAVKLMAEGCYDISKYVSTVYGEQVWNRYFAMTLSARKARETRRAKEIPGYVPMNLEAKYDVSAELKAEKERQKKMKLEEKRRWMNKIADWRNNKVYALYDIPKEYAYGGNVLLRLHKNNIVQTSKQIALSVDECARLWRLVSIWHKDESKFSSMNERQVMAINSNWHISSYHNDLLTAGCHTIAYKEMENLAKTLNFIPS